MLIQSDVLDAPRPLPMRVASARRLKALLVNDASLAGHHGSALVTRQIVRLGAQAGIDVTAGWSWEAALQALAGDGHSFDLVIVNGEGSLHSNSRAAERAAFIARDLASRRALPAYLINATVEGNGRDLDRALGQFRLRFVRDRGSQRYLSRAGVSADVVHDLTLTAADLPEASLGGPVLITDASDQETSRRLIALAQRWPNTKAVTLRAPPPRAANGSGGRRTGFAVKRQAARMAPLSPWSLRYAGALDTDAFFARLAHGASGVVCGRYHAVCLALRLGLPFLALGGNTAKTASLLSDAGLSRRLVTLETLEAAPRPVAIPPLSYAEQRRIYAFLATLSEQAADMLEQIADDARRWHGALAV